MVFTVIFEKNNNHELQRSHWIHRRFHHSPCILPHHLRFYSKRRCLVLYDEHCWCGIGVLCFSIDCVLAICGVGGNLDNHFTCRPDKTFARSTTLISHGFHFNFSSFKLKAGISLNDSLKNGFYFFYCFRQNKLLPEILDVG